MIAADPTTATATGFLPIRMAGRMNRTSTAKEIARPHKANSPRHRAKTTTARMKKTASAVSGPRRW